MADARGRHRQAGLALPSGMPVLLPDVPSHGSNQNSAMHKCHSYRQGRRKNSQQPELSSHQSQNINVGSKSQFSILKQSSLTYCEFCMPRRCHLNLSFCNPARVKCLGLPAESWQPEEPHRIKTGRPFRKSVSKSETKG